MDGGVLAKKCLASEIFTKTIAKLYPTHNKSLSSNL